MTVAVPIEIFSFEKKINMLEVFEDDLLKMGWKPREDIIVIGSTRSVLFTHIQSTSSWRFYQLDDRQFYTEEAIKEEPWTHECFLMGIHIDIHRK
jgi:hypothetical protein